MRDKIIQFLRTAPGYISGEEISRHLKISRAGIWKYMQELRQDGYEIVAVPHLGYKLEASPDKLLPTEIQFGLNTKYVGKKIYYYDSIGSTMDEGFRLGMEGVESGTVVCAETQTKGRGRLGRSWTSPKGKGIYFSIILRPQLLPTNVSQLTLMSAVALCEAVNHFASIQSQIKWPNDILVGSKKLSGILTEMSAEMDRVRFVVIGIGLNVNTPTNLMPSQSTSIKNEIKQTVDRLKLFQEILRTFEAWNDRLMAKGFPEVLKRWKELNLTLGRRVRIVDANGTIEGEAINLDEYGGLVIRSDSGVAVKRVSGDVVMVR